MTKPTTKPDSMQPATEMAVDLFDNWFDPIETEVRARARQFIEDRTAVYGPVCTVVREGRSRKAPPYPDQWHEPDQRRNPLYFRC
jgi:hypothetical protein